MIKTNETRKTVIALIAALLAFVLLFLVLQFHFILAGAVALLIFIGLLYFIPTRYYDMDGNEITPDIIENEMNQTLYRIHESGEVDLDLIEATQISDPDIDSARDKLLNTARTIYKEIDDDIDKISQHQFFLEYYIPKGRDIIVLYRDSQNAQGTQFERLKGNVLDTLALLQEVYDDELQSFYADNMKTMHYEKELLQQNVEKIRERNRIKERSIDSNIESIKEEKELLEKIKNEGE